MAQHRKNTSDLGEQAIALAEQLGRIAGTIEGTAESWMDRQALTDQLTRVRDSANQMLEGLTAGVAKGREAVRSVGLPASAKATAGLAKARRYLTSDGGQPDRGKKKKAAPAVRSFQADPAHAPGKRRRKPGPSVRGIKKSDETIFKSKAAAAVRQRRKSYA